MPKKGPIVTLDGDVVRYRTGFASQDTRLKCTHNKTKKVDFHKNITEFKQTLQENESVEDYTVKKQHKKKPTSHALYACKAQLDFIKEKTNCKKLRIVLSGKDNYRSGIASFIPYKGARATGAKRQALIDSNNWDHYFATYTKSSAQQKPLHFNTITDYLIHEHGATITEGIEADDELTIKQSIAWRKYKGDKDTLLTRGHIIASIDKDLMQAPGWFFNFTTKDPEKQWHFVDEAESEERLWYQVMTGDMTDNIFGIAGLGAKGAEKLLAGKSPEEFPAIVKEQYELWWQRMHENQAKLNPMLLHLLENYAPEDYMNEVKGLIYTLRTRKEHNEMVKKHLT